MPAKKILTIISVIWAGIFIFETPSAHAGGAAVKRRQAAPQIAQQKAIHQRAVQQAVMQRQFAVPTRLPIAGEIGGQANAIMPDESQVKEVVDIENLWKTFETTSENWPLIMETQAKVLTVDRGIHQYQEKGITIAKPPLYYAQMIDGISQQNPALLKEPLDKLLQFVAIVEYDFDNGTDKDQLAKKFLGEQVWKSNRHRLGLDVAK